MISVIEAIRNVERNADVYIYVDRDEFEDCGWYIPEDRAIGISANISDDEAIESIVHEVAHHVDISENDHEHRCDIDGEVIAHCVERVVCDHWNVNSAVIDSIADDVREVYCINGVVSIDASDINEVAARVSEIVGI